MRQFMSQDETYLFVEQLLFAALLSRVQELSLSVKTWRGGKHGLALFLILCDVLDVFVYLACPGDFVNGFGFGKMSDGEFEPVRHRHR